MSYAGFIAAAQERHLNVLGGFYPNADDDVPEGCATLLLLGPDEPAFWPVFTTSPEWRDGAPDPVDRWSRRVIGTWAAAIGAQALFPFGGPPYAPFYSWALRTGRTHRSPVHLLVHDEAGLFVSFRGALALSERIDLPEPPAPPCDTCVGRPCTTACAADALTPDGYDVARCQAFLATPAGAPHMQQGCGVRRACPVSQTFGRLPAQSAYHMRAFAGAR